MTECKDRRSVRRTKRLLKTSLIQLLQEKDITKISVSELAKAADINRGTFYLHYQDIYALLDELENDVVHHFAVITDHHRQEILHGNLYPVLQDFLLYISDQAHLFLSLLKNRQHNDFMRKLRHVLNDSCFRDWIDSHNSSGHQVYEYCFAFIMSGYVGMLEYWIKRSMQETPEEIARIAEKIILQGISVMQEDKV